MDNSGYELAAAGADEPLLELELLPSDDPELDELDEESELDDEDPPEEDESDDDDEPAESLLLADPPDELLEVLLAPSRLSLR